jgi:molybdate transport repressor ModE-like protein
LLNFIGLIKLILLDHDVAMQPSCGKKGGKSGGGAILTPFGLSLVARYRKIELSVERAARKELLALRTDVDAPKKA